MRKLVKYLWQTVEKPLFNVVRGRDGRTNYTKVKVTGPLGKEGGSFLRNSWRWQNGCY